MTTTAPGIAAGVCLLLAGLCLQMQADLLGLPANRMLLMRGEVLRRHVSEWHGRAGEPEQRLFALASSGLPLFALLGLSTALVALAARLR